MESQSVSAGSSNKQVIIFGAGGHGKVLADIAQRSGRKVAGFVDDRRRLTTIDGINLPVLGNCEWLLDQQRERFCCGLGIGDNPSRMRVGQLLSREGFELATLVSPFAVIAPSARIGAGVVVVAGAIINPLAEIAEGAIVNSGVIVEHDAKIGRYANLSPNSTLGGEVEIGELAHVAMSATVLPRLRVGSRSTLGAGSVATSSIPDGVIAYGIPARVQRALRAEELSVGVSQSAS
jgi:sugar O-acyltransferase (sialic acid O-acetyltransferase NeuD family)